MPKNLLTNARSCAACGRLLAMKTNKRHTCSTNCETEFRAHTRAQRKRTRKNRDLFNLTKET
ncbi:hypothetical protein K3217_05325 [bacterium BD-1]|nr:hypothetical protein [Ottowia caeni]